MRPWTLVLIGVALTGAAVRAFLAPFPGPGGNPYLDLIAFHDPGLHRAIHAWYFLTPGVAVLLAGSITLSDQLRQALADRRKPGSRPI